MRNQAHLIGEGGSITDAPVHSLTEGDIVRDTVKNRGLIFHSFCKMYEPTFIQNRYYFVLLLNTYTV